MKLYLIHAGPVWAVAWAPSACAAITQALDTHGHLGPISARGLA